MSSHRGSWDVALAENVVGLCVVLAIVAILISFWVTVKALALLVRVIAQHHENRVLRVTLGLTLISILGAAVTSSQYAGLDMLAGGSVLLLVAVAKIVELAADGLVQRPGGRGVLIEDVLHRPWWEAA